MEQKWRKVFIALLVAFALAIGIFAIRGGFTMTESYGLYACMSDAFFVPGILFISFFLLLFISGEGVFNIFGFAAVKVFLPFLKKNRERSKMTYYEYCQSKSKSKNKVNIRYMWVIGTAFLAFGGAFALLCEMAPTV